GEATWRSLADGVGGVGLLLCTDRVLTAYAHLTHHHAHGWSFEVAARPDADAGWLALVEPAMAAVAAGGGGHVALWLHGSGTGDAARARPARRDLRDRRGPRTSGNGPRSGARRRRPGVARDARRSGRHALRRRRQHRGRRPLSVPGVHHRPSRPRLRA